MATEEFKRMINGVEIVFPCKPYPSQFSMMDKVIKGIERRQNCLLESPTGSGKSLALLCSALAWQVAEYDKKAKEEFDNKEEKDGSCCTCKQINQEKLVNDISVHANSSINNTNGGKKICTKVVKGILAESKADILVNTTSQELQLSSGAVSASILEGAGKAIQEECREKYPHGIRYGEVAVTDGYNLQSKKVYHGSVPAFDNCTVFLEAFVTNCLQQANDDGLEVICFPSIGTGNLNYPKEVAAQAMFQAVKRFETSGRNQTVTNVNFVIFPKDIAAVKAFENEENRHCASANKTVEKPTATGLVTIPDSDDDEDDFKDPGTKFRTPGNSGPVSKTLKRKHQSISYETSPSTQSVDLSSGNLSDSQGSLNKSQEKCCSCSCKDNEPNSSKRRIPKIYFGTRTHKQITQIIRELKKTAYREAKMTILASREHTCIHPAVSKMSSKPEGCKELLDGPGCRFKDRVQRCFQSQDQIKSYGLNEAWDIEDLVHLSKHKKACAYFGSRALRKDADIIFCPYNYLVDPVIREAMEIELKDQIVILDEAHNIEDSAREAASESLKSEQLDKAIKELDEMAIHNIKTPEHLRLRQMCSGLQKLILDNSEHLNQSDFDQSYSVWSGYDIIVRLKQEGIGPEHFDNLKKCYSEITSESEEEKIIVRDRFGKEVKLSATVLMTLKEIFKVLDYLYREDLKYVPDYRVAVVKANVFRPNNDTNDTWLGSRNKRGGRSSVRAEECSLNFWCMNPGVAFSDFTKARNVILTSGTLSPMASFQSELGVPFPIQLEANHVIQDKQVWVGAIGRGPSGGSLQAVYKTMESWNFQDELGMLILNVCEKVPHGVLVFLPSYRALGKFTERWQNTRIWHKIQQKKRIVTEPRASQRMDFEQLMKYFYNAIEGDVDDSDDDDGCFDGDGALFIAVCRGKVSEGLDFADNNARAVITVGIPYPNFKDVQVKLKREYNDKHRIARGLLSGSEWYEIQAFRALNQALGRCIRHRKDWGALILVDERFVRNDGQKYIRGLSKWVRNKVQNFTNFGISMDSLSTFTQERLKDMPKIDPDTSFIPSTPITPGRAITPARFKDSPISSTPKTADHHMTSPNFITPYRNHISPNHGGSFLNSPQPLTPATSEKGQKPCTFMSPTEVRKNPLLQQAASTQQIVQAQPGIQNHLFLLPSQGQVPGQGQPAPALNPVYNQILQIMNSPHVPKDKPYYIIINEGTPNQQMFLIEPPKQPVNPQITMTTTTVANQPSVQQPIQNHQITMTTTAVTNQKQTSVQQPNQKPVCVAASYTDVQQEAKESENHGKQFLSLLSGHNQSGSVNQCQKQELSNETKPALLSYQHHKSSNENASYLNSNTSGDQAHTSNPVNLDSSELTNKSLYKFCNFPNKGTPFKDEPKSENKDSIDLTLNRSKSPCLFDADSQSIPESEPKPDCSSTEKPKLESTMSLNDTSKEKSKNNTYLHKKPLFKKCATLDKFNGQSVSETDQVLNSEVVETDSEKDFRETKSKTNCTKHLEDSKNSEILSENKVVNNSINVKTGLKENVEGEHGDLEEEDVLKTRRSSRGVKRRTLSRNRSSAKRAKGVDFLDNIADVKENKTTEKQSKLVCSSCRKVLLPDLKDFEKRRHGPEFGKNMSKQNNPAVVYVTDLQTTEHLTSLQSSVNGTTLNSTWDPATGCCMQYLQCVTCNKKSKTGNTPVIGVSITCTTQPDKEIQPGQAWFLSSSVKVE